MELKGRIIDVRPMLDKNGEQRGYEGKNGNKIVWEILAEFGTMQRNAGADGQMMVFEYATNASEVDKLPFENFKNKDVELRFDAQVRKWTNQNGYVQWFESKRLYGVSLKCD